MNTRELGIKELTNISIGVATMIVGGLAIYQLSYVLPIPGVKYILMSPYLSMVIFIMMNRIKGKYTLLKFGMTFGLIMIMMNLYMGLTIILTALLSQVSILAINKEDQAFYGAVLFSAYTGFLALLISKYMIGGIFMEISFLWLLITGLICLIFGITGTQLAKHILKHLVNYSYE